MSKILNLLQSVQAIYTDDHFVYTSGKHGEVYINKDSLYPHTKVTSQVCKILAKKCSDLDIDTVVAPALGGIILSQWISFHLSKIKGKEIYGVYAEKDPVKTFIIGRGYDKFVTGKNVLVVEDLTTTGGSVKKVVDTVREYGGKVVGVCVMVNRNKKLVTSEMFDAPLIVGANVPAKAWDENKCKLCKEKKPINTHMGHGKKYVQSKTK
ncbi:MAG: phosphoribosyltransferase family protein [Candidatus Pacebacteria bacterium]|nr:phosphoribosyltransferase family protein [Candidatus Paceibacterota bacterium]